MSAIDRFETFMENLVEGSMARLFRSPIQPAELAKRLERAMEASQTIGPNRVIVPNLYRVFLHPQDLAVFAPYREDLEREMAAYLGDLAQERRFGMLGHPRVTLGEDAGVARKTIQVVAEIESIATASTSADTQIYKLPEQNRGPRARLTLAADGGVHVIPLESTLMALGRGLTNDIILEDSRVSRHHAQLRYQKRRFYVTDMQSTNGTFVNAERVADKALNNGDVLSFGGLELIFNEA